MSITWSCWPVLFLSSKKCDDFKEQVFIHTRISFYLAKWANYNKLLKKQDMMHAYAVKSILWDNIQCTTAHFQLISSLFKNIYSLIIDHLKAWISVHTITVIEEISILLCVCYNWRKMMAEHFTIFYIYKFFLSLSFT